MGRLTGKVAIVTGAAARGEGAGNGAATAILFAREDAAPMHRSAPSQLPRSKRDAI
jgi:NAD(P)-dependent dehydrogenase (short-subunit alcohol dehydrogenase family)